MINRITKGWPVHMTVFFFIFAIILWMAVSFSTGLGFFTAHLIVQAIIQLRKNP